MSTSEKQSQVLHVQGTKSFGAAEGKENERRWDDAKIDRKNTDPDNHYDKTRMHLNFEVGPDGKIHPLGYQSKPLEQRLEDRLQQLGWHPFKEGSKNQPNCAVEFILGGSRERINEMAFGVHLPNLEKGSDNSHIERMPEIEQWALDNYAWLCRRFGAENVIGLQIHLDETSVHAHGLVIPVGVRKRSDRPCVMYAAKFGHDGTEYRKIMQEMHTSYNQEVASKYGLERGESVEGRSVVHLDKKALNRKLDKELAAKQKALKGLSTMESNLQKSIAEKQTQLNKITQDLADGKISQEEADSLLAATKKALESEEALLKDKVDKRKAVEKELTNITQECDRARKVVQPYHNPTADVSPPQISSKPGFFEKFEDWAAKENKAISKSFWASVKHVGKVYMTDAQKQVETIQNNVLVDYNELWQYRQTNEERENRLSELTEQQDILIKQLMSSNLRPLVLGIADALLSGEVPSSGGGGSTSDLPWDGRNRDEDEDAYHRRCLLTASRFVHRRTMNRGYRRRGY